MSCVCTDNGLREFPSNLGCIVIDGYGVSHDGDWLGFADETLTVNETVTAEVIIKTKTEMALFAHWYYNELLRGTLSFLITIPLFGITRAWEVRMMKGLNEALVGNGVARNIKMELEVLTDIGAIADDAAGDMLCENICGG